MDILAHGLWAGVAVVALRRRRPISRSLAVSALVLAVLPDLLQFLPLLGWWWFGSGSWQDLRAFALALPGQEPVMPAVVAMASHHLHCIGHSAVVAAPLTLLLWRWWPASGIGLMGWWSHIVIDVFTHSADYYASPVLYPLTYRGFDGIAWNTPWFMALNYLALAVVGLGLWRSAARRGVR